MVIQRDSINENLNKKYKNMNTYYEKLIKS